MDQQQQKNLPPELSTVNTRNVSVVSFLHTWRHAHTTGPFSNPKSNHPLPTNHTSNSHSKSVSRCGTHLQRRTPRLEEAVPMPPGHTSQHFLNRAVTASLSGWNT